MPTTPPYTGRDYAQARQTDMVTEIGMRLALLEAVQNWHGGAHTGANAREQILAACASNEYLQAAGTVELVQHYFANVIDTSRPEDVVAFLNDIDPRSIDRVTRGMEGGLVNSVNMLRGAGGFSSSLREHLGRDSLTVDFQQHLRRSASSLSDIEIVPQPMLAQQIERIDRFESLFRRLDRIDGELARVGLGQPSTTGRIAEFNGESERNLTVGIQAARRIHEGNSRDLKTDMELMSLSVGSPFILHDSPTVVDARIMADRYLADIVQLRNGSINMAELKERQNSGMDSFIRVNAASRSQAINMVDLQGVDATLASIGISQEETGYRHGGVQQPGGRSGGLGA